MGDETAAFDREHKAVWYEKAKHIEKPLANFFASGVLALSHNFGSYDQVYGDLGAAVGFLTWVWLSLSFFFWEPK